MYARRYSNVLILILFVSNKSLVTLNAFTTAGGDIKKMKNILYYSCCALTRVTSTTLGRAAAHSPTPAFVGNNVTMLPLGT